MTGASPVMPHLTHHAPRLPVMFHYPPCHVRHSSRVSIPHVVLSLDLQRADKVRGQCFVGIGVVFFDAAQVAERCQARVDW